MNANTVALLILTVAAPLGAFDVIYYHLWKFRLYARPESRPETVTHLLRGLLIGCGAILLAYGEPHGVWFWIVSAVFVIDFLNDIADVILEPKSRKSLGGLPPLEYLTHIMGAGAAAAATSGFIVLAYPWSTLPTEIAPAHEVPRWLAINGYIMGIGGLLLEGFETVLFIRARPSVVAKAKTSA